MSHRLEALNVTRRYGPRAVVQDVSLSLEPGKITALLGGSGAGKSTLLRLLYLAQEPSRGRIMLFGRDTRALTRDNRALARRRMGMVFQNFRLLDHLTALENVMLPLELRNDPEARQKATRMLQRVGLSERLGHRPRLLSGGEQQRVALARAFVVQPALLLADEPTGSLDHATGEQVMALMDELNRENGTTLVLVTHDEKLAARCDRRLRIEAGRLSETAAALDATLAVA